MFNPKTFIKITIFFFLLFALVLTPTGLGFLNAATVGKATVNSTLSQGLVGWWKFDDHPAYGSALGTDMDMEAADASAWTAGGGATLSKQSTNPHGGNNVLRVLDNGVSTAIYAGQTIMTDGNVYRITGYGRSDGTNIGPRVYAGVFSWTGSNSTEWQYFDITVIANTDLFRLYASDANTNSYVEFDDVTVKLVTASGVNDSSVNNAASTRQNGVTNATGRIGQGMKFDGVDDMVNTGADMIGTGADSVCAWIYPKSIGETNGYILDNAKARFYISSANTLGFTSNASTVATSAVSALSYNKWTHACATRNSDGTVTNLYINGVLSGTANQNSGTPAAGTTNVFVGNNSAGTRTFDGTIDDVRTYSRVLTPKEIQQLYTMGGGKIAKTPTPTLTSGLVGWWTFDGAELTSVTSTDKSGNGNNATRYNGATKGDGAVPVSGRLGQGMKFDGADDYVNNDSVSSSLNTSVGTFSAWVNFKNNQRAGNGFLYFGTDDTNNDMMEVLVYYTAGSYYFGIDTKLTFDSSLSRRGNTVLSPNRWYHLVGMNDGTNVRLFVNGIEETVSSFVYHASGGLENYWWDDISSFDSVEIGRLGRLTAGDYFDGKIDDVRLYSRALSAAEIKKLYLMGGGKVAKTPTLTLTSGLVGWWTFDGAELTSVTSTDKSGNGNNGTRYNGAVKGGGAVPVAGRLGQGLRFDASNDYIDAGSPANLNFGTGSFSMSTWVKTNAVGASKMAVSKSDTDAVATGIGYKIYLGNAGRNWTFGVWDGSHNLVPSYTSTVQANRWYHVVGVYNSVSKTASIYIDGIFRNSSTNVNFTSTDIANSLYMGRGAGLYWNGSLDDVRLYNRALSAAEVKKLYLMGK